MKVGKNGKIVEGGIEEKKRKVIEKIKEEIEMEGEEMEEVVKKKVWMEDERDLGRMKDVYGNYFKKEKKERKKVE